MRQFPRPVSQTKCSLSKCGNIPPRFLPWAVISPGHPVYYSLSITSRCAPSLQSVFCCFFSLPISVRVFIPRVSSHFSLYVPAPFILWVLHPAGTEGQIAPINLLQCACTVLYIFHSPFIFVRGPRMQVFECFMHHKCGF